MTAGQDKLDAALAECALHAQVLSGAAAVLPGLLAATLDPLPPEATFADRLHRLGALPSVERWKLLREVRNSLAHEYPEHPDLQVAALTRLVGGAWELLSFWTAARVFADRHVASSTAGCLPCFPDGIDASRFVGAYLQ